VTDILVFCLFSLVIVFILSKRLLVEIKPRGTDTELKIWVILFAINIVLNIEGHTGELINSKLLLL
jgi:hypothetical protein